jgi:YD repeat-containing protein
MMIIKSIKENFYSKSTKSNTNIETNFDELGNKINHRNGSFIEEWSYDKNGRIIKYENPGFVEIYSYDRQKNQINYSNNQGVKWMKIVDVFNNEILYEESKNLAWHFKFLENYINLSRISGLKWIKEYNDENLEVYYEDNLKQQIWKTYDIHKNIVKLTNKKNIFESFTYSYDEQGNMIMYKDSKGKEWFREYDSNGNLLFHKEDDKVVRHTYIDNLLVKTVNPNGRINSYKYDENRRVIERLDNNGYKEITLYDEHNNIVRLDNDVCCRNFEFTFW